MVVGYIGYLAFGSTVKSVILLNLPNEDPMSITAKCCYVLTIMGSFVLIVQPIFYIVESSNLYKGGDDEKKKDELPMEEEEEPKPEEGDQANEGGSDDADDSMSCC